MGGWMRGWVDGRGDGWTAAATAENHGEGNVPGVPVGCWELVLLAVSGEQAQAFEGSTSEQL